MTETLNYIMNYNMITKDYNTNNKYTIDEIKRQYKMSLHQISMIVYECNGIFNREEVIGIYGNYHKPLELYFHKYINHIFLGNEIKEEHMNEIKMRLKRLHYLHRKISNKVIKILLYENNYRLVKQRFYKPISNYIIQNSHLIKSFDNDTLRKHINEYLLQY